MSITVPFIKSLKLYVCFEKHAILFINSEKKIINSFCLLLNIIGC
nr:MAG TPA: hypothetical protein [Caudoviricetes sp.]